MCRIAVWTNQSYSTIRTFMLRQLLEERQRSDQIALLSPLPLSGSMTPPKHDDGKFEARRSPGTSTGMNKKPQEKMSPLIFSRTKYPHHYPPD